MSGVHILVAFLTLVAILYVAYSFHVFSDNNQSPQTSSSQSQPISITATQLLSDYQSNEIAADNQYHGKLLKVSGAVSTVQTDINGIPFVVINDDVQCGFQDQSQKNQLAQLHVGENVILQGTEGEYVSGIVQLENCSIDFTLAPN